METVPTDSSSIENSSGEQSPLRLLGATVSELEAAGSKSISGLYGSSRAYFLSTVFKRRPRPMLVLLPDDESAELFASDLSFFCESPVLLYPSTEVLPFDTQTTHPELRSARIALMARLTDAEPVMVVAAVHALVQRIMPVSQMVEDGFAQVLL